MSFLPLLILLKVLTLLQLSPCWWPFTLPHASSPQLSAHQLDRFCLLHYASFCASELLFACVLFAAFMCHHNVFLLYSSIRDASQERWNKITHYSVFASFLVTLTFGLIGYSTFTGFVQGQLCGTIFVGPIFNWYIDFKTYFLFSVKLNNMRGLVSVLNYISLYMLKLWFITYSLLFGLYTL